jgi:two-component system, OmpR family, response regulator VanR
MKTEVHLLKNLTILVVEDDSAVLNDMVQMLSIFFKEVVQASNGAEAFLLYQEKKPHIILTDVQMPISDGLSLVKQIRTADPVTPILLISSYSEHTVLMKALNSGVDGYIIKPLELNEILQTITESLRRSGIVKEKTVCFKKDILYNLSTKELSQDGLIIDLGVKEHALLSFFLHNRERTLTKIEIVDELWPLDEITDGALKSLLNRLRKKIGEEHIVNVKNIGWRLSLD